MKLLVLVCVLIKLICVQKCSPANVLGLFPHYGYSHFKVFFPILRGLVERGHKVTVVTYFSHKNQYSHANYTEILLVSPTGKQAFGTSSSTFEVNNFAPTRSLFALFTEFMALHWEGQKSCHNFYESGAVQKLIQQHTKEPFDLAIMEFFNTDCCLGVTHLLQVPVVGVSSCALMPWHYDRIALPDTPSYVQTEFVGFPAQLDWKQRLINFIVTKGCKLAYRYYTNWQDNKIVKKFLNIDVDVDKIANDNTSFILVNQHYSLIGNRPSTPQIIEIGGVHIDEKEQNEPLPQQIEDFLMKSPNGVLFISWGSMLQGSSIPSVQVKIIVEFLQKLALRVIWKWESEKLPTVNENFLLIKWAPQSRILCHPKVKAFWGHGGLLGVTEAVYCGKPMMITPIYGDQFLNGNSVENRKIGKVLLFHDISNETLSQTLLEITSEKFVKNAAMISKIFRNREMMPLEKAIFWIEHVLANGQIANDVLRVKAFHMSWIVYYSLDSIAIIVGLLFIAVYAGKKSVSCLLTLRNKIKLHRD